MPLACFHLSCWPPGPCDVRGVMLHPLPGASRKRLPPSADVPSGNTLGSITRRSHKYPAALQLPRQPALRFAIAQSPPRMRKESSIIYRLDIYNRNFPRTVLVFIFPLCLSDLIRLEKGPWNEKN